MSVKPRFQLVKDFLLNGINNQRYPVGSRIPTEMQLAQQFNVSRMTVHKAIRDLVNAGYLVRYQGQGTFVCEQKPVSAFADIRNIADEIRLRGHQYSNRVIRLEQISASAAVATQLGIRTGSPVYLSCIVHLENGQPVQLEERYINPQFAPDYLQQDFTQTTPNEYLTQTCPASDAEHIIEAILPDTGSCQLLEISANEPCLRVHRRTWSQQHLISSAFLTYPGSRYRLQSETHFS